MKIRICDICKKKMVYNSSDIKIKYRAYRRWEIWYEGGWNRIDICTDCLNKIISAKEGSDV